MQAFLSSAKWRPWPLAKTLLPTEWREKGSTRRLLPVPPIDLLWGFPSLATASPKRGLGMGPSPRNEGKSGCPIQKIHTNALSRSPVRLAHPIHLLWTQFILFPGGVRTISPISMALLLRTGSYCHPQPPCLLGYEAFHFFLSAPTWSWFLLQDCKEVCLCTPQGKDPFLVDVFDFKSPLERGHGLLPTICIFLFDSPH